MSLIDMEKAEAGYVGDHLAIVDTIMNEGFKGVSENGVLGDPAGATAEGGEAYLDALVKLIVGQVNEALS